MKKYKSGFVVITILGFVGGLFEAVSIGTIIPFFDAVTNSSTPGTEFITRAVKRVFSIFGVPFNATLLLTFIALLFVSKTIAQFAARYINAKFVAAFEEETRSKLLERTLKSRWLFLLNQKIGHLEGIILYDVEKGTSVLVSASGIVLTFTSMVMYAAVALSISAPITAISALLGICIFFIFKPVFFKIRQILEQFVIAQKETAHRITEILMGAKTIKTAGVEQEIWQQGHQYLKKIRDSRIKSSFYRQSTLSLIEPIGLVFIVIIFIFFHKSSTFNIASFAVIIYLVQKMFSFIKTLETHLYSINEAVPHLKAALNYYQTSKTDAEATTEVGIPFQFKNSFELKNVWFSYPGHKKSVLSNISFSTKKGEIVGIIGPSGSGKTTLADIVTRLLKPVSGEILVDGQDIQNISLGQWRQNIGYVPQDIFLSNDTIENNIRFFNNLATREEIEIAAKLANIYEVIQKLPDKFNTLVGERGIKLSGGQRQRIALARTLLKNPKLLILDEATSAVDAESERLIQEAIFSLRGETTIFIIAHRLSTIMKTDKLVVLENGNIIEKGPPAELLNNQNSYLYRVNKTADRIPH